jgi:hypothetical protein
MRIDARQAARGTVLCTCILLLLLLGTASGGAATAPGCASFHSQAEAQEYFREQGGSPRRHVGSLDPDHDGVACEGLGAPYQGYATLGYDFAKSFFYGTVAMPPLAAGSGYACLQGDTHFPEDPRRLNVYRERPGPDRELFGEFGPGAAADPSNGHLVWKASKALVPGRYYVRFEERIPSTPYGRTECPAFRSATVELAPR